MTYAPAMTLTGGWARLARAGVFGGASLFLATAGHVVGGGTLPGAGLLALTAIGLALVSVTLTARRVRFAVLLVGLAVEQILLHLLFHAASTAVTCAAVVMPGHSMSGASVCGGGSASTGGWPMLVSHALAVLATAWLLARGERWLWRVADRLCCPRSARPRVAFAGPGRSSYRPSMSFSPPPAGRSPVRAPRRSPDPTSHGPPQSGPPCRCRSRHRSRTPSGVVRSVRKGLCS